MDGRARQEVIQLPAEEVNTPEKLFALLERNWGEQRDTEKDEINVPMALSVFRDADRSPRSGGEWDLSNHC